MKLLCCYECSAWFWSKRANRARCLRCKHALIQKRNLVLKWVSLAVQRGDLVNLKTNHVACVDCGARANAYDHRDYNKPLEVVPVCGSCNFRRGHAVPFRTRTAA